MGRLKQAAKHARPWVRDHGYDVVRFPAGQLGHRRSLLMRRLGTDLVVDVGANVGQYGRELRQFGYRGRILSFEPMSDAFASLAAVAAADGAWDVVRSAVGVESGEVTINVAGNSISSSILPMSERHQHAAAVSVYEGTETVPIDRLDRLAAAAVGSAASPLLKIDTQGYESIVLDSASGVLDSISALELELSLVELYAGQELMPAMLSRVEDLGFRLAVMESGFWDRATGETLQINAVFTRVPWGQL